MISLFRFLYLDGTIVLREVPIHAGLPAMYIDHAAGCGGWPVEGTFAHVFHLVRFPLVNRNCFKFPRLPGPWEVLYIEADTYHMAIDRALAYDGAKR